jgi:hypothetical protein
MSFRYTTISPISRSLRWSGGNGGTASAGHVRTAVGLRIKSCNPFGQKIEAVEGIARCAAIGMIQQCIADNYTCKYSRSLR